eukprot:scpid37327/ scgid9240/ 
MDTSCTTFTGSKRCSLPQPRPADTNACIKVARHPCTGTLFQERRAFNKSFKTTTTTTQHNTRTKTNQNQGRGMFGSFAASLPLPFGFEQYTYTPVKAIMYMLRNSVYHILASFPA